MENEGLFEMDSEDESKAPLSINDRWECFLCHDTFAIKGSLTRHLKVHRSEKPHKCQFCDSSFRRPDHLYMHQKSVHPTELLNFECDECHDVFNTKSQLRRHKTEHVGAHQCEFCGRVFTKKQFLTVHKKTHTGYRPYSCELCSKSFTAKYFLREHLKRHKTKTPFKCETCCIFFQRESCLRGHNTREHKTRVSRTKKRTNSKDTIYSCEKCGIEFWRDSDLLQHQEDHKDEYYACDACNEVFEDETRLVAHKQLHESLLVCELCKKVFQNTYDLQMHGQVHYKKNLYESTNTPEADHTSECQKTPEKKVLECMICHIICDDILQLKKHLSSHPREKMSQLDFTVMCGSCGVMLNSESSIEHHECNDSLSCNNVIQTDNIADDAIISKESVEVVDGCHKCAVCGTEFPDSSLLATHFATHSIEKSQGDNICDSLEDFNSEKCIVNIIYENNDADGLVNVVTVSERKVFECDLCHKQFTTNSYLNVHKRAHAGIKAYTCDFCGKQFAAKCNLKIHVRLHTGEKPYNCEVCGKLFSDMSARNSHRRSHFAEKPFSCDLCERAFAQKQSLIIHKRCHSKEELQKSKTTDEYVIWHT